METKFAQQGSITIATVLGSIDPVTSKDLQTDLSGQLQQGHVKIVADFSQVTYI